jgi:hypothetical protein
MRIIGLVALVVVVLAGCAPSASTAEPEDTMTDYQDARSELIELLDQLQAVVPGEWTETEFGARSCALPDGGAGAQSSIQRLGPAVAAGTERDAADAMIAVLAAAGYESSSSEDPVDGGLVIRGGYPASGTDTNGFGIRFGVSPNGSTLDSMSACVPGDANEINEQRQD